MILHLITDEHPDDTKLEFKANIDSMTNKGSQYNMQSLDLQSFSYQDRSGLLLTFINGLAECGGWVLERRSVSPSTLALNIEIQLRSVVDLYASILSSGLELTRSGHLALAELCTCRQYLTRTTDLGQLVSIRIEISFLEEVTCHSLLMAAALPA